MAARQVVRYQWGGEVLWQSEHQSPLAPPCPRCKHPRVFQAQVGATRSCLPACLDTLPPHLVRGACMRHLLELKARQRRLRK